ncbi:MAG: class I SAM-dependent methyltransferase, partial [Nitrospiraceae bacterium]|nr:class I SAM-dependent methyltransferase [Nitrospiraceae bacterium]
LEDSLDKPLSFLNGKRVLEAGCGAGRFTEHLAENCGSLVSVDISNAVDSNLTNCAGKKPYMLIQADINSAPLRPHSFDVVICLGVIQHTPSPELTISNLAKYVKPGGDLVIDHYANDSFFSPLGRVLSLGYPLRCVLKRLRPEVSLKITTRLTAIADPLRKRTYKIKWIDRIAVRLLPSTCYYGSYPGLDPEILYEWNELDTFDQLTDYYKHFRSARDIRQCLSRLGFREIYCEKSSQGVTARATM